MNEPSIKIVNDFVPSPSELFTTIRDGVEWDARMRARKTASFGVSYDYSGITYPQVEMPIALLPVCDLIKKEIGFYPNNCLMNYYLDGTSSMGYHSDSSEELRLDTGVVIISLGSVRHISYRSKEDKEIKVRYKLENGALLYMDNDVQENWMHAILKEAGIGERISLTFRDIIK